MRIGFLRQELLTAAIEDETTGPPVNCLGVQSLTAYISGTDTIASGVITFEEADFNPSTASSYSGTWSQITTYNASGVSGGVQSAVHFQQSAYSQVRARVTTAIGGGGSVSVTLVGS